MSIRSRWRFALGVPLCLLLSSCGEKPTTMEEFLTRPVTLPDGQVVRCEVVTRPVDIARGLMFRTSLPADRGMLFLHDKPGIYGYWMYQTKMPLDIIWMDRNHTVVEVSYNTPPCPSKSAKECPVYGGHIGAQYVVEINAGQAQKHNVTGGSHIGF